MLPNAVITIDRQLGIELLGGAQDAEAVAFGQPQVGQHHAGGGLQRRDGLVLIACFDHGVALRFERMAQHRAQRVLVLDEQNRRIGCGGRASSPEPAGRYAGAARFFLKSAMAFLPSAISLVRRFRSAIAFCRSTAIAFC